MSAAETRKSQHSREMRLFWGQNVKGRGHENSAGVGHCAERGR